MDVKIGFVEKLFEQKKQSFKCVCITIVDANGNVLLNTSKHGHNVAKKEYVFKEKARGENKNREEENAEELVVSEELAKENNAYREGNSWTKENTATIAALLERKRSQIFTTKLNKTNYICFIDGKGLLTCRGRFNVYEQYDEIGDINVKRTKTIHEDRCIQSATFLVARKENGFLIVVTGDSNSKCSMIDAVNEVSKVLKDV